MGKEGDKIMKPKRSKLLLISAIIGTLYSIYIVTYFAGIGGEGDAATAIGGAIATALVMPHMILVVLATIFNWLGYFGNKRGFALTGAILYTVAGVVFPLYLMFVVPSLVLSFVGFAKLKQIIALNNA